MTYALLTVHANLVVFAVLLACACLTSAWKVNLPLPMSNGCTLSMSYAADLMALILIGPAPATIIAVAGAWTQCTINVKQPYPWYRTAFSMSAEALTMAATSAVYTALAGDGPLPPLADVPRGVVGAITTYFMVNSAIVAVPIALCTRRTVWRVWHDDFLWSVPSFIVAGTAGAAAAVVIQRGGAWFAILAVAPVYLTYRTYQVFLRRIEDERRHVIETQRLHTEAVEALALAKQAEQALAHEKERLAVTLRSIGDGVIATDLDGRVRLLNNVAEALTGWTQAEAQGQRLEDVFQPANRRHGAAATTRSTRSRGSRCRRGSAGAPFSSRAICPSGPSRRSPRPCATRADAAWAWSWRSGTSRRRFTCATSGRRRSASRCWACSPAASRTTSTTS
jgi:PAS domain-containing protein